MWVLSAVFGIFGDRRKKGYSNSILNIVRRDVKFKIILLDIISEAAKKKAEVEEKETVNKK